MDKRSRPNGELAVVRFDAVTVKELFGQLVGAASSTRFWDKQPANYPFNQGTFVEVNAEALVEAAYHNYNKILLEQQLQAPNMGIIPQPPLEPDGKC